MCACNGTGGVKVIKKWGAIIAPCPDTDCKFDRQAADRRYEAFLQRLAKLGEESA